MFAQKIADKCAEEIICEREINLTADNYYNFYSYNDKIHLDKKENIQEIQKNDKRAKTWFQPKKVYQYNLKGYFINGYNSVKEAGELNNVSPTGITDTCHGRLKTSGGFMWSFEKKNRIKFSHLKNAKHKK